MPTKVPLKVFISYAHRDEQFKFDLLDHLSVLKRNNDIEIWEDGEITVGQQWDGEIKGKLLNADVVLFLLSPSFSNSDYIDRVEIKETMERHKKGQVLVAPIVIRPFDFSGTIFSNFQAVPKGAKPVSIWSNQDEAWLDVVKQLKRAFKNLKSRSQSAKDTSNNSHDSTNEIDDNLNENDHLKKQINKAIAKHEMKQAIELLEKWGELPENKYENTTVLLLISRWSGLQKKQILDIYNPNDLERQINKLKHDISSLLSM